MEVSAEDEEYATRPMDWIQWRRRRGLDDKPEESATTTEASEEEDEHGDYNNGNGCVGGG